MGTFISFSHRGHSNSVTNQRDMISEYTRKLKQKNSGLNPARKVFLINCTILEINQLAHETPAYHSGITAGLKICTDQWHEHSLTFQNTISELDHSLQRFSMLQVWIFSQPSPFTLALLRTGNARKIQVILHMTTVSIPTPRSKTATENHL